MLRQALCRIRQLAAPGAGQSTVEFALVCAAFMVVVAGLAALMHLFDQGVVVQHALASASHHVSGGDAGAWGDVLSY